MPTLTDISPARRYRATTLAALKEASIKRDSRVIEGFAVITRGEALGHGFWIDSEFLDQVVVAGNSSLRGIKVSDKRQADSGIKSRFTHPGLCADGLGTYLGRAKNFRRAGDIVRADLHLSKTTEKAPGYAKDPGEYIMDLTAEDPEAFGASIVFYHDIDAEEQFQSAHSTTPQGKRKTFTSPDERNVGNLPHARLAQLYAADVVDEPAANPGGFLSAGDELAARGEETLAWLCGLSEVAPDLGGLEPERAREFFAQFLARRGLRIVGSSAAGATPETLSGAPAPQSQEKDMPMTDQEKAELRQQLQQEAAARLQALTAAFPTSPAFAAGALTAGLSVDAAKGLFAAARADLEPALAAAAEAEQLAKAELEKLGKELAEAKAAFAGSGHEGVGSGSPKAAQTFESACAAYAAEHKCDAATAANAVNQANPELFRKSVQG